MLKCLSFFAPKLAPTSSPPPLFPTLPIPRSPHSAHEAPPTLGQLLKDQSMRRPLVISIVLMYTQQLSG